jgi:diaminopimelate epimerase
VTDALRFSKYQASGNDFLIIDELEGPAVELDVPALCDRWVGAGADGVIRVRPGATAPFRFDLTNADGSSAEMSGNGMRCLAAYLREGRRLAVDEVDVETPAGLRHVTVRLDGSRVVRATVEMGTPNFTKAGIPMFGAAWETFLGQPFDVGGGPSPNHSSEYASSEARSTSCARHRSAASSRKPPVAIAPVGLFG